MPWMLTIAGLTVTIGAPLRYGNDARVVMATENVTVAVTGDSSVVIVNAE